MESAKLLYFLEEYLCLQLCWVGALVFCTVVVRSYTSVFVASLDMAVINDNNLAPVIANTIGSIVQGVGMAILSFVSVVRSLEESIRSKLFSANWLFMLRNSSTPPFFHFAGKIGNKKPVVEFFALFQRFDNTHKQRRHRFR